MQVLQMINLSDRKSMGGYIVFLENSPVSWAAKKHWGIQALSSTESEIIQVVETTKELLWLRPLLLDLGIHFDFETDLHTDNQPARHILLNNPMHSNQTKHMDIKVKFWGEVLARKEKISLKYIPTKFRFADIFTKPQATVRFWELRAVIVQNLEGIFNNSQFLQRTFKFAVLANGLYFLSSSRNGAGGGNCYYFKIPDQRDPWTIGLLGTPYWLA